ncbi:PKD domain-containing protein [Formosa sp. L2A11]|uniref:PKD domain-containing protein n=1 Tax=Formosa sp. L2A11 TaxID=2686363 RepID=UPI00131D5681|nr:PKD domain-containing protein [Formosa sp. L2A11]
MINLKKYVFGIGLGVFTLAVGLSLTACDPSIDALEFDLPDANSQEDLTPPTAGFTETESSSDYLTYNFANTSSSSTEYVWDYGDGNTGTTVDGENTYPVEGTYTVTLTASDNNGLTNSFSMDIEVVEPEVPPSIYPDVINGDFEDGTSGWKPSECTGCSKNAFNASSDGSSLLYDGSDSGLSKTAGAKYTSSTSAGPSLSSDTRYGYQTLIVSPNTNYILEYEYAIKTDKDDIEGGDRAVISILDGAYEDAADAAASTPILTLEGATASGKGNFTSAMKVFSSNATGEISILMYAITNDELFIDNVKVYPVE